jgi:hypothetical protein
MKKILAVMVSALLTALAVRAADVSEGAFVLNPTWSFFREASLKSSWTVDHRNAKGFEIYGPVGLKAELKSLGFEFIDLDRENFIQSKFSTYPSFEDLTKSLQDIHAKYPALIDLFSIGKSVEGRDLWAVQISKHVSDSTPLPEVKYISSMHGNEITGRELMVNLIQDLVSNYGKDTQITSLIDNSRIFIIPSLNPDGSFHIQRGNGHQSDLNRNFPDFSTTDNENSMVGREPETQAVMKFQADRHFALSANFHGGAEVVNYMWDTLQELHPLDSLLKEISLNYADKVSYLRDSMEFPQGITNGFAWYEVNGGMQDWSYYWYDDLQFTIELSNEKYPSYSTMGTYYAENKEALVQFLATVHQGAGVLFEHADVNGAVSVYQDMGEENDKKLIGTFPLRHSYFYKVLQPGKYLLVVEGNGAEQSVNVEVKANEISSGGNFVKL